MPTPERVLVERCLAQETGAWVELIELHQRRVLRVIHACGGAAEAADLCQEVWTKLYADGARVLRRMNLERPGALALFLARMAQNATRDHLRRRRETPGEELPEREDSQPGADVRLDRARMQAALVRAAAAGEHPERDGEVVRLALQGLSPAEIAGRGVGVEPRGVEAALRRVRQRAAELLREPGAVVSAADVVQLVLEGKTPAQIVALGAAPDVHAVRAALRRLPPTRVTPRGSAAGKAAHRLHRAIALLSATLPARDADVLRLHYGDGLAPADIAAMGLASEDEVEALLQRVESEWLSA